MVLDKNLEHKKDLLFNVNFFYLKSFKDKSSKFSYVNKPFFRGTIVFGLDIKDKMRPLKFDKIDRFGKSYPVNPKLFKKFLLADQNKFVAFSKQTNIKEFTPIMEMLDNFQIDRNKISSLTFCKSCLDENKFTLLNKGNQIKSYKYDIICPDCALDSVLKQVKLTGLISSDERISPKLKNFFNHMILKFKDVRKVLSAFKPDFDPVINKEITLYDIEKKPSISKKYLNYYVKDIDIPSRFKKVLESQQISKLLPIQAISIEKGLLSEHNDQLIMAPTSGGKTLIGELAGISNILENKKLKMLYLVPIVALANIRTDEFTKKYKPLQLKIVKKVGESLFDKKKEDDKQKLNDAHIIIATYEAIDYILRSGNKEDLGDIGTVIIDEIQTLIDQDRGYLLDGFIGRLKSLFKNSQYLYLSATIGEPSSLAEKLNSLLIQYTNRPVPIERHLLLCPNESIKHRNIAKLVRGAFSNYKSKYGYKGQSIIFTNTRKKCESLTSYLQTKGIKAAAYHSGLTNEERKIIENKFLKQHIAGVVATAALAAGVDLPASQVIFESLAMGINWLTVASFEQMLGRAGRLGKHALGLAYILVEPGKIYTPKMKMTEENIAIKLLNGKIKDFELNPDEDRSLTELLAFISMFNEGITQEEIFNYYSLLINNEYEIKRYINRLQNVKMIRIKENFIHKRTQLGQAVAKSFLTIEKSLEVIEKLNSRKIDNIIDLALDLKPLKNVYLSKKIVAELSKNINMKYFSNNFFSASVLSLMNAEYVKKKKSFSREFINFIMKWVNDIFNCNCKDNPYCDCGRLNLEKIMFQLRAEEKFSIEMIHQYLEEVYKIVIFKGDIIDFFENLIYSLESVYNISKGINIDINYKNQISGFPKIIEKIKN